MIALEELNSMDDALLHKTAEEIGVPNPSAMDRQALEFAIIDTLAENTAKEVVSQQTEQKRRGPKKKNTTATEEQQPKKRGRKPKAKTEKETKAEKKEDSNQVQATPEAETKNAPKAEAAPAPKKRGRKSKAELAAIEAQKAADAKADGDNISAEEAPKADEPQPKKRGRKPGPKKNAKPDANLPAVVEQPTNLPEINNATQETIPTENIQAKPEEKQAETHTNRQDQLPKQQPHQKRRDFQPHKNDGFDSFFGNSKGRSFMPRNAQEHQELILF